MSACCFVLGASVGADARRHLLARPSRHLSYSSSISRIANNTNNNTRTRRYALLGVKSLSSCAAGPDESLNRSSSSNSSSSSSSTLAYDHLKVEQRWQQYWKENCTFRTPEKVEDETKPKYYVLDMFPYPSGAGLHVGHPEGYTATDILARYKRMRGFNVMHPMGWDAFGLPAEQYAIQTGTHPAETTAKNVARFREQLQTLGFSYDWARELSTTQPDYYKWTQWIFLQLFKRGLAYQDEVAVNWCAALGTVLANEEVIDGLSERGGHPVERKPMKQWVLRITAYAERLLEDLELLDWPESIKEMQRNWIGKSEGVELSFKIDSDDEEKEVIKVFTTRPETVGGVSYVCVAPEYKDLDGLVVGEENRAAVDAYVKAAAGKSDRERTGEGAAAGKTGVPTGSYAVNPVTGERVPVWVADYVLASYGTGAVMAVPAHDERDWMFAKTYALPIKKVIAALDEEDEQQHEMTQAHTGDGVVVNWGGAGGVELDGLRVEEARLKLMDWVEESKVGKRRVNYKLRDWLFSRQRYWGEPFPIVFVDGEPKAVPEEELPITLPELDSFAPAGDGRSPLANAEEWLQTSHAPSNGAPALRETNTMPQWAGSCWYYLRFLDPSNAGAPVDPALEKYWMPVDLYVGGVEHAVLHLLYARFWHKVLYDCGVVSTKEPFQRLVNQGMILGEIEYGVYHRVDVGDDGDSVVSSAMVDVGGNVLKERREVGVRLEAVSSEAVVKDGEHFVLRERPEIRVVARAHKMSKSRGNVVNPDHVVEIYGADALRCYLMFMGPLEQVKPWSTTAVSGMARFLSRVWRLVVADDDGDGEKLHALVSGERMEVVKNKEELRALHVMLKKVTEDTESLRFNTAIAAVMEFVNAAYKWEKRPVEALEAMVLVLSPYAPHLCEELWRRLGHADTLAYEPWPNAKDELMTVDEKLVVVQVNGKVRAKITMPLDSEQDAVVQRAMAEVGVQRFVGEKTVFKQIFVPNRLLNLVVK